MADAILYFRDADGNTTGQTAQVTVTLATDLDTVAQAAGVLPNGKYSVRILGDETATLTVPAVDAVPVNTAAPIASGDPVVGGTATCGPGEWTNDPTSFSYEWRTTAGAISGMTGLSSPDVTWTGDHEGMDPFCRVTPSNSAGAGSPADSNSIGVIQSANVAPEASSAPVLTVSGGGSLTAGKTVLVTDEGAATGTPTPVKTTQIQRAPTGTTAWETTATATSYTTNSTDEDYDISALVTWTNSVGEDSARSNILTVAAAATGTTVGSRSALLTALAAAEPDGGIDITLLDADYGPLTLTSYVFDNPVRIVAANSLQAVFEEITLTNCQNITFDGVKVDYPGTSTGKSVVLFDNSDKCGFLNGHITGASGRTTVLYPFFGFETVNQPSEVRFEGNLVEYCYNGTAFRTVQRGSSSATYPNTFLDNEFDHIGGDCNKFSSSVGVRIEGNRFTGTGATGQSGHRDFIQCTNAATDLLIRRNLVMPSAGARNFQCVFGGFSAGGGHTRWVVEQNIFFTAMDNCIEINAGINCDAHDNTCINTAGTSTVRARVQFPNGGSGNVQARNIQSGNESDVGATGISAAGVMMQRVNPGGVMPYAEVFPGLSTLGSGYGSLAMLQSPTTVGQSYGAYEFLQELLGEGTPPDPVAAPVITGPTGAGTSGFISVNEGTSAITTLTANEAVTWSEVAGLDDAQFAINASTGAVTMPSPPSVASDTVYSCKFRATSDASGLTSDYTLTVTVRNIGGGSSVTITSQALILNTSDERADYTSTSTITCAGGAGTRLVVVAQLCQASGNETSRTFSMTAGGVAMTKIAEEQHSGAAQRVSLVAFMLENPTAGAKSIVLTLNGVLRNCVMYAYDLAGCDDADPLGTVVTRESTAANVSTQITPEKAGSMILSALGLKGSASNPTTPDAGVTEDHDASTGGSSTSDHNAWFGHVASTGTSSVNVGGTPTTTVDASFLAVEIR